MSLFPVWKVTLQLFQWNGILGLRLNFLDDDITRCPISIPIRCVKVSITIKRGWRYQRVIRIRKSTKNRQHNGQWDNQISAKHTHKTKNWVTRFPLKIGGELRCSGRLNSPYFTGDTRCVNIVTNPVISHLWS